MTEQKGNDYDSVDLTEDEDSSEGNFEVDSPFHFVDCSNLLNDSLKSERSSPVPEPNTSVSLPVQTKKISEKNVPKVMTSSESVSNKKVERFTSVQIKPPTVPDLPNALNNKHIETVCLDSDNELDSSNHLPTPPPLLYKTSFMKGTTEITLPQTNTIYSPKQPPGKVVIIKKNNKYYKIIIPHNVMPNINQSLGPVLINIPEVGPLVISNDPQATKTQPNQFTTQQLSLNLDAVERKQDPPPPVGKGMSLKDITLRDKKFCWTFNTFRKRDLDGFCITDNLGFNKMELKKAKKCEKLMSFILAKQMAKLSDTKWKYEMLKKSLRKKNKVKLVKINSIIQGNCSTKDQSKSEPNFHVSPRVEQRMSSSFTTGVDEYGSDLLVTKKVVILGNNDAKDGFVKRIGKGKPKSKVLKNGKLDYIKNFNIKPCSVQITKDHLVEKYCDEMGLNVKKKLGIGNSELNSLKNHSNRILPDHRDFEPFRLLQNTNLLKKNLIRTEDKLRAEINAFKPFLILTEHTISVRNALQYYGNEFDKNNILYIVGSGKTFSRKILSNRGFISAVEIGYVKLVTSILFSKFVKDGMRFRGEISNHRMEHNYSYVSN